MASKTTVSLTREVPGLDVDGIVFAQDGSNPHSKADYHLLADGNRYTLRDCTEGDGPHWRLFGPLLDFYAESPERVVVELRKLGATLTKVFGEP